MPAWRHADSPEGFEVAIEGPLRLAGQTAGAAGEELTCVIVFDADGLTRDYPGIGTRVA